MFLKSSANDEISDTPLRKTLKSILKKLPPEFVKPLEASRSSNVDIKSLDSKSIPTRSNSSGKLRNLADKGYYIPFLFLFFYIFLVQNAASKGHQRLMQNSSHGLKSAQRLAQSSSSNLQQFSNNFNSSFDNDCTSKPVIEVLNFMFVIDFYKCL